MREGTCAISGVDPVHGMLETLTAAIVSLVDGVKGTVPGTAVASLGLAGPLTAFLFAIAAFRLMEDVPQAQL